MAVSVRVVRLSEDSNGNGGNEASGYKRGLDITSTGLAIFGTSATNLGGGAGTVAFDFSSSAILTDGGFSNTGFYPSISSDGNFLTYRSEGQVFLKNMETEEVVQLSVTSDGANPNGDSFRPEISDDGSRVVFLSWATNLDAGTSANGRGVFSYDTAKGELSKVPIVGLTFSSENYEFLSSDGQLLIINARQPLVDADTNSAIDVYAFSFETQIFELISFSSIEGLAIGGLATSISNDGNRVLFSSRSDELSSANGIGDSDVFVHDRRTKENYHVSVGEDGQDLTENANALALSGDGRYSLFQTFDGSSDRPYRLFVHEVDTGESTELLLGTDEAAAVSSQQFAVFSDDGRRIVISSFNDNLVANDFNGVHDVFSFDNPQVFAFEQLPLRQSDFDARGLDAALHWTSYENHGGIDFGARDADGDVITGTPVRAVADGILYRAAEHSQFGELVILEHGNGYYSLYAHLDAYSDLTSAFDLVDGDYPTVTVSAGEVIGTVGNSGTASEGPHLHFSVLKLDDGVSIARTGPLGVSELQYSIMGWATGEDRSDQFNRVEAISPTLAALGDLPVHIADGTIDAPSEQGDTTWGVLDMSAAAAGASETGSIERPGDKDWFKLAVEPDTEYTVTLTGTSVRGYKSLNDGFFNVKVWEASANDYVNVPESDPNRVDATENSETLKFKSGPTNTEYFVVVGGGGAEFSTVTGGYSLTITPFDPEAENQAPSLNISELEAQSLSVDENTTFILDLEPSDPDGDELTYSTSGSSADLIEVDQETGQLSFKDAPDFENPFSSLSTSPLGVGPGYEFSVTVTDDGGLSDTAELFVRVTDVVEIDPILEDFFDKRLFLDGGSDLLQTKFSDTEKNDVREAFVRIFSTKVGEAMIKEIVAEEWDLTIRNSEEGSAYNPALDRVFLRFEDTSREFLNLEGRVSSLSLESILVHEVQHFIDDKRSLGPDAPEVEQLNKEFGGIAFTSLTVSAFRNAYSDPNFDHFGAGVRSANSYRSEVGEVERGSYYSMSPALNTEIKRWENVVTGTYDQAIAFFVPNNAAGINEVFSSNGTQVSGRASNDLVIALNQSNSIDTGDGSDAILAFAGNGDQLDGGGGDDLYVITGTVGTYSINDASGFHDRLIIQETIDFDLTNRVGDDLHIITSGGGEIVVENHYANGGSGYGAGFIDRIEYSVDPQANTGIEVTFNPTSVAASGAAYLLGSDASDQILSGDVADIIRTGGGSDEILGSLSQLSGDVVTDFSSDDKLVFLDVNFGLPSLKVTLGSAILDIDYDLDGVTDSVVTLEGNFEAATFNVEIVGRDTVVTVDPDGLKQTYYIDLDRDGFGVDDPETNLISEVDPGEGFSTIAGDADDSRRDINPDAPELNDGVDNDQDGETDEDNRMPDASDDMATVVEDRSVRVSVLANDTDADGDVLSILNATDGTNGTTAVNADGTITYTPDASFSGEDTFSYTVSDGFGGEDTATVSVSVTPDTPPPSSNLVGQWLFDDAALPGLDTSPNDNPATFRNGATVSDGQVTLDGQDDHVFIDDLPEYDLENATIRVTFSVDALDGTESGRNVKDSSLQALFSRDGRGFDAGGHVTAWVDGDGSVLIRHQTESDSFFLETVAAIVTEGEDITLVYNIGDAGSTLFVEEDGLQEIGAITGDLGLSGNDQPWILGASQISSRTEDGDRLRHFLDGSFDSFEFISTDELF